MIQKGFSLIEMVFFIAALGIISVGILMGLSTTLNDSNDVRYTSRAIEYAQERMEFIIGQKDIKGFSVFTDPCTGGSPPTLCTHTNYTITSSITTSWSGNANFTQITVTVTGLGNASLSTVVANY